MRFQNFHLYKTDFSSESLESLLSGSAQDSDSTEQNNLGSYIQKTAYALEGVSWSACNRPLSTYARNRLLYIQSFTYYEVRNYYTRRDNDKFYSFLLKYTYEGEGELVYEGKTYSLGPNQGFVIDCKKPHEYRALKSPWNHVEIHFSGAPANYIYEKVLKLMGNLQLNPSSFRQLSADRTEGPGRPALSADLYRAQFYAAAEP